jgi:hypothetical protein
MWVPAPNEQSRGGAARNFAAPPRRETEGVLNRAYASLRFHPGPDRFAGRRAETWWMYKDAQPV